MAITYKAALRSEPGVKGGGEQKYYPVAAARHRVSLRELSNEISRMSSLSPPDVYAVLEALTITVPQHLAEGHIVELGNLCNVGVVLGGEGVEHPDELSARHINKVKAHFRPKSQIKEQLQSAGFEKLT